LTESVPSHFVYPHAITKNPRFAEKRCQTVISSSRIRPIVTNSNRSRGAQLHPREFFSLWVGTCKHSSAWSRCCLWLAARTAKALLIRTTVRRAVLGSDIIRLRVAWARLSRTPVPSLGNQRRPQPGQNLPRRRKPITRLFRRKIFGAINKRTAVLKDGPGRSVIYVRKKCQIGSNPLRARTSRVTYPLRYLLLANCRRYPCRIISAQTVKVELP